MIDVGEPVGAVAPTTAATGSSRRCGFSSGNGPHCADCSRRSDRDDIAHERRLRRRAGALGWAMGMDHVPHRGSPTGWTLTDRYQMLTDVTTSMARLSDDG